MIIWNKQTLFGKEFFKSDHLEWSYGPNVEFEDYIGLTQYQYSENSGQKVHPKYGSGVDPYHHNELS